MLRLSLVRSSPDRQYITVLVTGIHVYHFTCFILVGDDQDFHGLEAASIRLKGLDTGSP